MIVQIVKGKNYKNFLKIVKVNSIEELEAMRQTLTRKKYLPFLKGFNKTVTTSYLISDTYIPIQFLQEIQNNFAKAYPFEIQNPELLKEIYDLDLNYDDFRNAIENINLPEGYNVFTDEYIYQSDSVYRALRFKTARIKVGTGGGKTLITYLYIKFLINYKLKENQKILIVVPRKGLVIQTVKEFNKFNKNNEEIIFESVYAGAKRYANARVIVGTYQSLSNYENDYFDDFSVLIVDEAHTSKVYSIKTGIYNKMKNVEYAFGMTATYPAQNTTDYLDIVAMLGPLVLTKKLKELIADGNIVPIIINRVMVEYNDKDIKYFTKNLKIEQQQLDEVDRMTGSEIYRAEKEMLQNYDKRNQLLLKIVKQLKYNQLFLVENVDYLELLFSLFYFELQEHKIYKIHGIIREKERQRILQDLEQYDKCILIATYETMSTGISVNNIHYVHFADGGKSIYRVLQGIGRGVRLHDKKQELNVFDYVDDLPYSSVKKHANERLKIYNEEELIVKEFKNIKI